MDPSELEKRKRAEPAHSIHELLARRFSPYAYAERTVDETTLRSLFEAARWAASSYNEQPWSYIVATREDPDAFGKLVSCLSEPNRPWAKRASALAIGVVSRLFRRNGKPNRAAVHDLGLAAGNLLVEATARGLWVHQMIGIIPERARELYEIPEHHEAYTALAIGHLGDPDELPEDYAKRDRAERTRKPLREFVFGARFGEAAEWLGD